MVVVVVVELGESALQHLPVVVELGESALQHFPVVVELGESALQHLPVERANLHRPGVVVLVVVLVHQGPAVFDLMGKRGATDRDTVVRTIQQNLPPCSCFHPVRSASEVAERALWHKLAIAHHQTLVGEKRLSTSARNHRNR